MGWIKNFKKKITPKKQEDIGEQDYLAEQDEIRKLIQEEITQHKTNTPLKPLPPSFTEKQKQKNPESKSEVSMSLFEQLKREEEHIKNNYTSLTDLNKQIDVRKVARITGINHKLVINHQNKKKFYKDLLADKINTTDEKLFEDIVRNADKIIKHRIITMVEFYDETGNKLGGLTIKGMLPENKNLVDNHWLNQTISSQNFNELLNAFKTNTNTTIQSVLGYKSNSKPANVANIEYGFNFA